jgi:hypothetical protein
MRAVLTVVMSCVVGLLLLPGGAAGHAERQTHFPDASKGERPSYRSNGPSRVVCKPDSAERIASVWAGRSSERVRIRRKRLAILKKRCRYEHIQAAVNDAKSGERILIMPGVYREEPSREVPDRQPECAGDEYWEPSGDNHTEDGRVPAFKLQHDCPNSWNLIAIIGDSLDDDRECDLKCNIQMEGLGRRPEDVVIEGDRHKEDVIRADRADGFVLQNVMVEQGRFNNVNIVETNGFRVAHNVARYGRNYGILTFASDNGLYYKIEAYGNGDSGVYPGSGPEGGCERYGIEVREVNSYGNTIGYSGTAGNGTRVRDSKFHGNSAGVSTDSFAPGHPGMPQDCSRWERNEIHSNNANFYEDDNEAYCNSTPFEDRRKEVVCPWFQAPVGTGIMMYGANRNIVGENRIYDNWRSGIRLFWVPASVRGDDDPSKQFDTSNGNRFTANVFGERPDGTADPNGVDVFWDEEGVGNCWSDNRGPNGRAITSDPTPLPDCASGGSKQQVGNNAKLGMEVPCAAWHPQDNPDPPGCNWFTTPPEPQP